MIGRFGRIGFANWGKEVISRGGQPSAKLRKGYSSEHKWHHEDTSSVMKDNHTN